MSIPSPEIEDLILDSNGRLETTATANATQAFNLGCSLVLTPGLILVILLFVFTRGNWIIGAVTSVLVIMASLALANLVAQITKHRSLDRIFAEQIRPKMDEQLKESHLTLEDLGPIAADILPATAALLRYLPQTQVETTDMDPPAGPTE